MLFPFLASENLVFAVDTPLSATWVSHALMLFPFLLSESLLFADGTPLLAKSSMRCLLSFIWKSPIYWCYSRFCHLEVSPSTDKLTLLPFWQPKVSNLLMLLHFLSTKSPDAIFLCVIWKPPMCCCFSPFCDIDSDQFSCQFHRDVKWVSAVEGSKPVRNWRLV